MVETIEVQTQPNPQLSVIWLHGLGASGHDFEPIVPYLAIPPQYSVRYIFPHAPMRAVTINTGMRMRAWYDIVNPAIGYGTEDREGIEESAEIVRDLIRREQSRGLSSSQIVLAGFSQGGAIALYAGIRHHEPLAGIMALSTYLPLADTTENEANPVNSEIPILYCQGTYDMVITVSVAIQSKELLEKLGYVVEWKTYTIDHSVSPEEITDIGQWLTERCRIVATG